MCLICDRFSPAAPLGPGELPPFAAAGLRPTPGGDEALMSLASRLQFEHYQRQQQLLHGHAPTTPFPGKQCPSDNTVIGLLLVY